MPLMFRLLSRAKECLIRSLHPANPHASAVLFRLLRSRRAVHTGIKNTVSAAGTQKYSFQEQGRSILPSNVQDKMNPTISELAIPMEILWLIALLYRQDNSRIIGPQNMD